MWSTTGRAPFKRNAYLLCLYVRDVCLLHAVYIIKGSKFNKCPTSFSNYTVPQYPTASNKVNLPYAFIVISPSDLIKFVASNCSLNPSVYYLSPSFFPPFHRSLSLLLLSLGFCDRLVYQILEQDVVEPAAVQTLLNSIAHRL